MNFAGGIDDYIQIKMASELPMLPSPSCSIKT